MIMVHVLAEGLSDMWCEFLITNIKNKAAMNTEETCDSKSRDKTSLAFAE